MKFFIVTMFACAVATSFANFAVKYQMLVPEPTEVQYAFNLNCVTEHGIDEVCAVAVARHALKVADAR
jgi:hypothetical protein